MAGKAKSKKRDGVAMAGGDDKAPRGGKTVGKEAATTAA